MQAIAEHTVYKLLYEQLKEETTYTIASLSHQLEQLKKMIFDSKSERFIAAAADNTPHPQQLTLSLDAETIATCKITSVTKVEYLRTKTEITQPQPSVHPGRMKLPEHLRLEIIILQPDADVSGLKKIGDEITEVLDFKPGELFVKQYIRPKYVQPLSDTDNMVLTASLPEHMMQKSMAGEGLVAQIIVDKYDRLPTAPAPVAAL